MIDADYYEIIAADICGISPERIWERTREPEVVLARHFCIVYRKDVLGLLPRVSAERYFQTHSMYYTAVKNVNNYLDTKDFNGELWKKFSKRCEDESTSFDGTEVSGSAVLNARRSLETVGWTTYVSAKKRKFVNFFNDLRNMEDEEALRKMLPELNSALGEIGYLLNNE